MEIMTARDAALLSPLGLAYIGDGIYELLARRHILARGNMPVQKLHRATVALVRASAQSQAVARLEPLWTEEEAAVYKRGRNTSSHPPKNADAIEYRRATGLEALFGYLYLTGRTARLEEMFAVACGEVDRDGERGKCNGGA